VAEHFPLREIFLECEIRYVKHITRPIVQEIAGCCPLCKGEALIRRKGRRCIGGDSLNRPVMHSWVDRRRLNKNPQGGKTGGAHLSSVFKRWIVSRNHSNISCASVVLGGLRLSPRLCPSTKFFHLPHNLLDSFAASRNFGLRNSKVPVSFPGLPVSPYCHIFPPRK
jgi:hypothetical protein